MSISYTANFICGFKLEVRDGTEQRTKYREDTGDPYTVSVVTHRIASVQGRDVLSTKENPNALCVGEEYEGLTIFKSGYEKVELFLGIALATVDCGTTAAS